MKRKFMQAILPFRRHTAMAVRERPDFHTMSSNAVLNEFVALEILEKNADEALARAQHMSPQPKLALKAKASPIEEGNIEEEEEEDGQMKSSSMTSMSSWLFKQEHFGVRTKTQGQGTIQDSPQVLQGQVEPK